MPTPDPSADVWTVARIIEWTTQHLRNQGSETPRLEAEILLAHARGCPRIQLYVDYNSPLSDPERAAMRALVQRRARAEPVAYLVGHREFFGLDFRVTPDVLIPRPETETLVLELISLARKAGEQKRGARSAERGTGEEHGSDEDIEDEARRPAAEAAEDSASSRIRAPRSALRASPPFRVLDVGTGSGCIAVALAVQLAQARITATDISQAALAVASANAERHGAADRIRFVAGDLFSPLANEEPFDFIVSNPPYVADAEMETLPPDVRLHEPHLALRAGPHGLSVIERLVAGAAEHLAPGGHVLIEVAPEQAAAVAGLIAAQGRYEPARLLKDAAGTLRVVVASACR